MKKTIDWSKMIGRVIAQHKGNADSMIESATVGITRLKREIHERLLKATNGYAFALRTLLSQLELLENLLFNSPREAKYAVAVNICTALACIVALDI